MKHTNAAALNEAELKQAIRHLTQEQLYAIIDQARYSFDANVRDMTDKVILEVA